MLCHPDISLPANYALQIRMSRITATFQRVDQRRSCWLMVLEVASQLILPALAGYQSSFKEFQLRLIGGESMKESPARPGHLVQTVTIRCGGRGLLGCERR